MNPIARDNNYWRIFERIGLSATFDISPVSCPAAPAGMPGKVIYTHSRSRERVGRLGTRLLFWHPTGIIIARVYKPLPGSTSPHNYNSSYSQRCAAPTFVSKSVQRCY